MAKFCPLFSGSTGNCTYIGDAKGGLLIDAGGTARGTLDLLEQYGIPLPSIQGILVTHEHIDHIKALKTFSGRLRIPTYASPETLHTLCERDKLGKGAKALPLPEEPTAVGDFLVERFPVSHDCAGTSGYRITLPNGIKMAVCTDLGFVSDPVRRALAGCDLVMLESNHDIQMLKNGPYSRELKLRILSDTGHLSNTACDTVLPELVQSGATRLVLAHLSRENNLPTLAFSAAKAALLDAGMKEGYDYLLKVAPIQGGEMIYL